MAGKVFISCGQRGKERGVAESIKKMLKKDFSLNPYLAFKTQSLDDIMVITKELASSDYYLFIDFLRKPESDQDLECSLFTHQELALAHHLKFKGKEIIALQEKGAILAGFLKYVLSNPEPFKGPNELCKKIKKLVKEKEWSWDYSRNLIVREIGFTGPWSYSVCASSGTDMVYQIKVENKRSDIPAIRTICSLDYYSKKKNGTKTLSHDRSNLKCAGQATFEPTIRPKDFAKFDLFAIRGKDPGIFLHSQWDGYPQGPVIEDNGIYQLFYKIYSEGFQPVEFTVEVNLKWSKHHENFNTTANLLYPPRETKGDITMNKKGDKENGKD
jgi:hypothetical protein